MDNVPPPAAPPMNNNPAPVSPTPAAPSAPASPMPKNGFFTKKIVAGIVILVIILGGGFAFAYFSPEGFYNYIGKYLGFSEPTTVCCSDNSVEQAEQSPVIDVGIVNEEASVEIGTTGEIGTTDEIGSSSFDVATSTTPKPKIPRPQN